MKLYPSILTSSLEIYQQQIELAQAQGAVEIVQVDVIDGYFADNLTLSPLDLTLIDYSALQLDFHLMVEEPLDFVQEIIALESYLPVRSIIAQVERLSHQDELLQTITHRQWQAGLSLDLHTPPAAVDDSSWENLQILQLMTIKTGFQGQEFQPQALEKVATIRQKLPDKAEVIVDGGVKIDHLKLLQKQGIDGAAVGSGIWQATDPQQAMIKYLQLMSPSGSD